MPGAYQPQAVSLEWHQSPEGQGILAHIVDPTTGIRKRFGLIEEPKLPPTIQRRTFKLFLAGKSGIGKTTLVTLLAGGLGSLTSLSGETPGLRVTKVPWPVKARNQIILCNLSFWDTGEAASKKYGHLIPVASEGASGAILVFSFTDKQSFQDLENHLGKLSGPQGRFFARPIVIGNRFGAVADSEVSQQDIFQFESKWRIPVLRIRNFHQKLPTQSELALILNIICDQLCAN